MNSAPTRTTGPATGAEAGTQPLPAVPPLATTPPQGWNSWDCFGTTVTEQEVLANAEVLRDRLLPTGWDTVVVDIAWYDRHPRAHGYNDDADVELDAFGRQLPAPNRFPSAAGGRGFGPLATAVHGMGLRFGVHLLRGIPRRAVALDLPIAGTPYTARDVADTSSTCAWNPDNYGVDHDHPGAQAWYDGLVAQLASWGVDFLKVDDILAPYHRRDIEAVALAIRRSGRPIVLSLSPGTRVSLEHVSHLREHAQMWRVSDDLWDRWEDVHTQFGRMARWAPFQGPGAWADADMLPLGHIGIRAERGDDRHSALTADEQRTLLTLWVMSRSPLMMGGDLPTTDAATLDLLAHEAVGRVLRDARQSGEVLREPLDGGELIVWTARDAVDVDPAGPARWVAVFWTGDADAPSVSVPLSSVGWPSGTPPREVRDLWDGGPVTTHDLQLALAVPAHGVRWLEVRP